MWRCDVTYKAIERRLEQLERQHQEQHTDAGLTERMEALDPATRSAIEALSPVDRERWVTGMEWFGKD